MQTSPSKVVEVHARALTKIIAKEPKKIFRFEEIEEDVNDKNETSKQLHINKQ